MIFYIVYFQNEEICGNYWYNIKKSTINKIIPNKNKKLEDIKIKRNLSNKNAKTVNKEYK